MKRSPRKQAKISVPSDGSQSVTFRLHLDKLRHLEDIARRKGTTRSAQMQTAIAEFIERELSVIIK